MPILLHSSGIRLTSLTSAPIRSGNSVSGKNVREGPQGDVLGGSEFLFWPVLNGSLW
jgi:hypothetical protein